VKRPEPPSAAAERRSCDAAEWLARRDRGLTAAEQDAFLQWLAADPRHGEWLALHRRTVADFTGLADWRPEHGGEPNPDLLAPAQPGRRWRWPLALAAAAAVAAGVLLQSFAPPPGSGTQAPVELRRRILEDGTTVELNRGAVVTTAFTRGERRTSLVSGEALFAVTKDPARPFIVEAGGVEVRAVGTAFSVRLDARAVEVLVTEGRVAVGGSPPAGTPEDAGARPALVDAGHRATVGREAGAAARIEPVSAQAMARELHWQPQLLDFAGAPLGVAVAEFNRRNRTQLVLADPGLADLPVIASIRSDNVEGFVRFLEASRLVRVERRGADEIVVERRP
jgi:transmembrane sensor